MSAAVHTQYVRLTRRIEIQVAEQVENLQEGHSHSDSLDAHLHVEHERGKRASLLITSLSLLSHRCLGRQRSH